VTLLLALVLVGCGHTNVRLNREWDAPEDEAAVWDSQSPDAFVDRLGEPDEWINEGEDDDVRMTATWRCLDGKDRVVTWRQQPTSRGVLRWAVVSDTSQEADCD